MFNSRIIVVGSGAAGIAASSKLIENGFKNVMVLEAENRIGGRINTIPFGSNVVDLGAQWCHGEKNNVVYDMVNKHNVLEGATINYPTSNFLKSTGELVNDELCGRLMHLCFEILENSKEDLKNFKGSLGNYVVAKYQEAIRTSEYKDIDTDTANQLLEYFHKYENSIESSDTWFETSGNGYLHYYECEGNPLLTWKDKGYRTVLDFLMKKLPNPINDLKVEEKILYNKEVVNIEWSSPKGDFVKVKCADGSLYEGDHVIVTASLGVLKESYEYLFNPNLPAVKINAIEGLSFGTVDKIYLEFEKPFWSKDWSGFSMLWTMNDSLAIRGTDNKWLEDVFGFYKVDYQPNMLCGWIGGPSARRMELLDDNTVLNGCMMLFEKFLDKKMNWTTPIKIHTTKWYSNKNFRGSYSFRSVKTDLLKTSANDLAQPLYSSVGKPRVLFAGEATSDHYYSTVHGAIESGWREAKRLVDYHSKNGELLKMDLLTINKLPEVESYDVIVIGAGISGLGAAEVLRKAGVNYMVLEGQNRIGGRINTIEMMNLKDNVEDKINIDAGAQWLHGKNNELFKLANNFNLIRPEESSEGEGDYIREDGLKFDEFFIKKVDFKISQIMEECEEFASKKNVEGIEFPESLEDFLIDKFQMFIDDLENDTERSQARQILDWHKRFQIIDNSCFSLKEISAKDWGNYSFNGESCQTHINVFGGMEKVVDCLGKVHMERISLNKFVDLICWKSEENQKRHEILIECQDGTHYSTKYLICTLPLGVLKDNHQTLFVPPLPQFQQDAIDAIGYGTINKIFLHFDEKWWDEDWQGLQLIWQDELNDSSHWTRYISGFDVVFPEPQNVLLGWIGGRGAIAMEQLSNEQIADECMTLIRKFTTNPSIPSPSKFQCSRWNSNKFIRGAYSFTCKNCDKLPDWEKTLSKPIVHNLPDGTRNAVLLAGEATHHQYFSTVHGAFLSGMEQAETILNFISEDQNSQTRNGHSCFSKL
ncbi:unnamed protein product [Diamesa serratosioi]